jgi:hypothetical protein
MGIRITALALWIALAGTTFGQEGASHLPFKTGRFAQQIQARHTVANGLPTNDVRRVVHDGGGGVYVDTAVGVAGLLDGVWKLLPKSSSHRPEFSKVILPANVPEPPVAPEEIRDAVGRGGSWAIAAESGLYLLDDGAWTLALPQEGIRRWAPVDVRAVAIDAQGALWFASPQGVGSRTSQGTWKLFTGAEGLPFNDFTCMATGPDAVWFGTSNGAICFKEGRWEFRQGRRWLLDNHVRDISVTPDGRVWLATPAGLSCIETRSITLAEKAAHYEEEIDRYHRRTSFGYVSNATMPIPGIKEGAKASKTDNDGHYTGIYLAAVSLGYGATGDPDLKEKAKRGFEALAFLSKVTEGGSHPAPSGFIARSVVRVGGLDPNIKDSPEHDLTRAKGDKLWKSIAPRWPIDETGEWYWKNDSSTDELDGHYFGYGTYFDHVCETEAERDRVRDVVRRVTDHLMDHNFNQVDHDGTVTRWGHMSPEDLNRNEDWWFERGLNSQSILTFLQVAHHITGEMRYRDAYLKLIFEHGYAMNVMTSPKIQFGPGSLGQGDDNMAFMNYYHLIRYETEPTLLSMYHNSIYWYWNIEKYERNPYFNFIYAACCQGKSRTDHWGTVELSPPDKWMEMGVDTLKRYPLDLIDWPLSNAHRIDVVSLGDHTQGSSGRHLKQGHKADGSVFPIDENHALTWGYDPWYLEHGGNASRLRDPAPFLIAYYMGLAHGFIVE